MTPESILDKLFKITVAILFACLFVFILQMVAQQLADNILGHAMLARGA